MTIPDPFETLQQIVGGYTVARSLHVVANLGVADALEESPRSAAELAAAVGAHPDALGRVLRLLCAHGIFEARGEGFQHSPASRLLRTDHPHSLRDFSRMLGSNVNWTIFGALEHTIRTGAPAADEVLPEGFWAYLAKHPEESRIFNAAMTGKAHGQVAGIMASYDFAPFQTIGDIGGGSGHLLRAVLDAVPLAKGVLFDLPHVVAQNAALASERLTLQPGDFFRDELPRCDAYLLMEIVHDWGDDEAIAILRAVRRAAPPHARVLLIESLIPPGPGPAFVKILDIFMLTLLGGRQRSLLEYGSILERAGLELRREIETGAGISVLETVVA